MAIDIAPTDVLPLTSDRAVDRPAAHVALWRRVLSPLASLRLTVTLFGLSIFIIFAGTGAQVNKDIWLVIEQYFRTAFAWVEFKDLLPLLFLRGDVPGGFYFPGGWLIGTLLTVNLVAAHLVRFKIQASGARLAAGLAVIALGVYVTWLVITRGDAIDGLNRLAPIEWSTFWNLILVGLASLWVAMAYALWQLPHQRTIERWTLIIGGVLLGCTLAYFVIGGQSARLSNESLRILWQLTQGGLAGVVLLAGCAMVFARRGGIVLLHGGVGLLMFGELWVGLKHVEGQMHIKEGEVVNYVQDIRSLELAVIDSADKDKEHVVAIPERRWLTATPGNVIADDALPFDLQLIRFHRNSTLRGVKSDDDNPATAGEGRRTFAVEQPQVSGTDSSGGINQSAAYIKLLKKGTTEPIGVHLVSLVQSMQDVPEKVAVDGKTYDLYLRFKRTYKDYAFQLLDFRFDRYVGTNTPKNYSSDVRVVNQAAGDDRHVKIWMNNPLRYQGETFYQQSFTTDPITNQENGTILQVVTNSGWMIPYVACMLVATGLLGHFTITLLRFLRSRAAQSATEFDRLAADGTSARATSGTTSPRHRSAKHEKPILAAPSRLARAFPIAVCSIAALWMIGQAYKALSGRANGDPHEQFDLEAFGRIPVAYEGRIKPLDTLARNTLRKISDRETFVDDDGVTQPAIRWLLDVMSDHRAAYRHKVFRIQNLELLSLLGHERREGYRFSIDELHKNFGELEKQARQAAEVKSIDQSVYQKKVIELADRLKLYLAIREAFAAPPASARRPAAEAQFLLEASSRQEQLNRGMVPYAIPHAAGEGWEPLATAAVRAQLQTSAKQRGAATPQDLARSMAADMAEGMVAIRTEPLTPEQQSRLEQNILHAANTALNGQPLATEVHPWAGALVEILSAYRDNKPEEFNRAVARYTDGVAEAQIADLDSNRVNLESFFNGFAPFTICKYLYLFAFILAVISWIGWSGPFSRAALWLTAGTIVLHTLAIVTRIYISGRPPVTNLYTTAIFIGWACAICGFILELVYRLGFGSVVAGVAGFVTLTIGDGLAARGDTFTVMQAVLDTQFWLATHVVTINTGYAASFLGGLFAALYIFVGLVSTSDSQTGKQLARMTYGSICFGLFTSFVGTVLGGLWADDSWGRFWGWDPKENGALIIVLWNAIILHARWGGMVLDRGLAVLAVLGNIFVAWSWFGVNELGTGLHSYGFTEGIAPKLGISVVAFLAIAAAGLIPLQYWRGFRDQGRHAAL